MSAKAFEDGFRAMAYNGGFAVKFSLPAKVLSPNVRAHWAAKARATRAYREACRIWTLAAKPRGWKPCAVVLDVEYRCFRKASGYVAKDIQNAISAMKAGVDGLVDAGVAPDDSKKYLSWGAFNLFTRERESPQGAGVYIVVRRT